MRVDLVLVNTDDLKSPEEQLESAKVVARNIEYMTEEYYTLTRAIEVVLSLSCNGNLKLMDRTWDEI